MEVQVSRKRPRRVLAALGAVTALAAGLSPQTAATASVSVESQTKRYVVVLSGQATSTGFDANRDAALALVRNAGGIVSIDLSRQIGVLVVDSPNALFDETLRASGLVEAAAEDFKWKAFPSAQEAIESGQLTVVDESSVPGSGPEETADPLEPLQWSMQQIRAPQAHAIQSGGRLVDVGILDSGIDGDHPDFTVDQQGTNVDCTRAADFIPLGPGIGNPVPCEDNQFHGTHVAGIVAAQANEIGVVGVAPNVTLVPVEVCDTLGYCYSSSSAAGITYAGDQKFDVINMSYFVDDDEFLSSTEFKCMSDPVQRAFRMANERAMRYARNQGVTPVAALGNSDEDLAHPSEPYENECEVVPAETDGVIGTSALGPSSEKSFFSNYGYGMVDVAAPGGNSANAQHPGPCGNQVLSTIPVHLGSYGCFQGTSMASPHAAGVAALIVSEFGEVGTDAGEPDVRMRPQSVESYLQGTTVDIGLPGYDECFGNGRIDALRAVLHDTSRLYEANPPCPEYAE
ncbi:MAG TPA: S8 family serine peptidase [Actinomycetota bacterium]|nr:S8 family serine peptidase [Actinomycetota bacterium]